jgi:radical SAM superfamily enzyme YgiQ (UPF0313 family)
MIKKILLFGDFAAKDYDDFWQFDHVFFKTSALLRLGYALRKENFKVKQIHHCSSFNREELDHIIGTFSDGEEILICISSSFLSSTNRLDYAFHSDTTERDVQDLGGFWGKRAFTFLKNIGYLAKTKYKFKVIMGGFDIRYYKLRYPKERKVWGIDFLDLFIDYYVMGDSHEPIVNICKGIKPKIETVFEGKYLSSKLVKSPPIRHNDWEDFAFTPDPQDYIAPNEALISQIAGGCIFSCSFCTYQGLGKKPHQFCRSYESLKREIVFNWENSKTCTYMFVDNMINDYWEKLRYLIRIKDETGIPIRYGAYARLDTIKTKEQAKLFRDSGAAGIIFGIESMKKEVGPYLGKMTDGKKIIQSLELFREAVGETCMTSGSFISGAPTETKEDLRSTFDWLQSEQGKQLLDHYIFTPLFVEPWVNERNEINKARGNVWKDYKFSDDPDIKMRGTDWVSPWGTYDEFLKLAIEYSNVNNKSVKMEDAMVASRGIFAMTVIHNVIEGGIDEFVRNVRERTLYFHHDNRDMYKTNTKKLLQNYKKSTLGNYYGAFG